jgi:quercetin dioxygenase-like cupin family protein
MKLANLPTGVTDWAQLPETTHPGESGTATARVRQCGEIQLRLVEYSAGYLADHWCHKGHIVFVVAGRLTIEHQGAANTLTAGMTYHVADNDGPPHRLRSESGATIFIVY